MQLGYFVGGTGFSGQDHDASVTDYNREPRGQPGLWCKWEPTEDKLGIQWSGMEKFYDYVVWLQYICDHFLEPWGYTLSGEVSYQGEEDDDLGIVRCVPVTGQHHMVSRVPARKSRRR